MDPLRYFECGGTRQFTATFSSTPPVAPAFSVWAGSGIGTCVYSATAVGSDATHFYAPYTMPGSEQIMVMTWVTSFNDGPVISRVPCRVIFTTPG